jgi:heptosyltransferase-2
MAVIAAAGPVLFFHMNQLGDLLFSIPAIEALRRRYPANRFISIVPEPLAALLCATGLVDEVIAKPASLSGRLALIHKLRSAGCSAAVLFSESPESLLLARAANIPCRAGFASASLNMLLTDKVSRCGVPSLANNANLALHLEAQDVRTDYTGLLMPDADSMMIAGQWMKANGIEAQNTVVLSPGARARRAAKSWQEDKWINLAKMLQQKGLTPVFTGAPRERGVLEGFVRFIKGACVYNADGRLESLAGLMAQSKFFVGIDSGAMHLAAALGVQVVALFGSTDPVQVGPRPLENHMIIRSGQVKDITVEEVWAALQGRALVS